MSITTYKAHCAFRVIRDDNLIAAFSADFRAPDRLQQAWQDETGHIDWRDVEVVMASALEKGPKT